MGGALVSVAGKVRFDEGLSQDSKSTSRRPCSFPRRNEQQFLLLPCCGEPSRGGFGEGPDHLFHANRHTNSTHYWLRFFSRSASTSNRVRFVRLYVRLLLLAVDIAARWAGRQ